MYRDWDAESKATVKKFGKGIWFTVGTAGFSAGAVRYPTIAFNNSNIPYVAYRDGGNESKITVMRFVNDTWGNVGPAGFSDGLVDFPSLAIGADNIPYVAYQDDAHEDKISVKKFSHGIWQSVGDEGFSHGAADYVDLAIGSDGVPYVIYSDLAFYQQMVAKKYDGRWISLGSSVTGFSSYPSYYAGLVLDSKDVPITGFERQKATVMRYDNSKWDIVGGDGIQSRQSGSTTNIVIDDAGTPYIGWLDVSSAVKFTVSKFNGSDWEYAGNNKFSNGTVSSPFLGIHSTGELFSAYADVTLDNLFTLKKLAGETWQDVETNSITEGVTSIGDFKMDKNGKIYIVHKRNGDGDRLTVKYLDDGMWYNAGLPGTAAGNAAPYRYSLGLDSHGTPYLAYSNPENAGKATVRRFNGSTWELLPGSNGFSDARADHIKLAIDNNDDLFVCFVDQSVDGKVTVMQYNKTTTQWSPVGGKGFTDSASAFVNLAVDPAGNLVLLHDVVKAGFGYRGKLNLKKYKSGQGWRDMADAPVSAGKTWWPKLTLDKTGTPFVTYMNWEWDYAYIKTLDIQLPAAYKEITSSSFAAPYTAMFLDNSELLCLVKPTLTNSFFEPVTAKVWVDATQPAQFVKRHYQLAKEVSAPGFALPARVTLYFTNDEFKSFNNQPNPPALLLPDADDPVSVTERKANLMIEKRGGISSDNSGSPFTYPGEPVNIDPADNDIIWNSTFKRWEITFGVTGFSGFFVKTTLSALPVKWIAVNAILNALNQPLITWKVQEYSNSYFSIEYSPDGNFFITAGTVNSKGEGLNSYAFVHEKNISGRAYYRIRQTDRDGKYAYSKTVSVQTNEPASLLAVYPNPAGEKITIAVGQAYLHSKAVLMNTGGITLQQIRLNTTNVIVDMKGYAPGIYILQTHDGRVIKIMKN